MGNDAIMEEDHYPDVGCLQYEPLILSLSSIDYYSEASSCYIMLKSILFCCPYFIDTNISDKGDLRLFVIAAEIIVFV